MEFIKKHWKKIIVCLFVVLFMTTCVSNCSHKNEIRKLTITSELQDEVQVFLSDSIDRLNDSIRILNVEIEKKETEIRALNRSNRDLNHALDRKVVVNIKHSDEAK